MYSTVRSLASLSSLAISLSKRNLATKMAEMGNKSSREEPKKGFTFAERARECSPLEQVATWCREKFLVFLPRHQTIPSCILTFFLLGKLHMLSLFPLHLRKSPSKLRGWKVCLLCLPSPLKRNKTGEAGREIKLTAEKSSTFQANNFSDNKAKATGAVAKKGILRHSPPLLGRWFR